MKLSSPDSIDDILENCISETKCELDFGNPNETGVKVLSYNKDFSDFEISWIERRTITGVVRGSNIENYTFSVLRKADLRLDNQRELLYAKGLNRQFSRALNNLWPHEEIRPSYTEYSIKLRKILSKSRIKKYIRSYLSNVKIDDLPIESIAATSIKINQCNLNDLRSLIEGTNARINEVTIFPRNYEDISISLSARGSIRIYTEEQDWQRSLDYTLTILDRIQLI